MIAAQKAKQIADMKRPFGSNFITFINKSKPQIVNIFFAFVCVILAYQIHAMRAGIRKLQTMVDECNSTNDKLRNILANLSEEEGMTSSGGSVVLNNDDDQCNELSATTTTTATTNNYINSFSMSLATKCANVVRKLFQESERKVGYSWILGKKFAVGDELVLSNLIENLHSVILTDIQLAVGDAAFTPDELKERRVAALKVEKQQDIISNGYQSANIVGAGRSDASMGDLMGLLEEVHSQDLVDADKNDKSSDNNEDGTNTTTKVRRARYAI
jgi:hypothetical protein